MLKKILGFGLVTLTFLGTALATRSNGKCEKLALQQNFDASKYVGTWFEQARDKNLIFEHYDCSQARYTAKDNGDIAVLNTEFNPSTLEVESATATAKCNGAACKVYFVPFVGGDYEVLSTDYENYTLVYSCEDLFLGIRDENVWILTRDQTLSADIDAKVKEILAEKVPHYNWSENFHVTKHGGSCKYLESQE